jgi:hypothetical protein
MDFSVPRTGMGAPAVREVCGTYAYQAKQPRCETTLLCRSASTRATRLRRWFDTAAFDRLLLLAQSRSTTGVPGSRSDASDPDLKHQ